MAGVRELKYYIWGQGMRCRFIINPIVNPTNPLAVVVLYRTAVPNAPKAPMEGEILKANTDLVRIMLGGAGW